jgi:hypothetical protein
MMMVELFALNVSPVVVVIVHGVELDVVSVHVPSPMLIVRVPEPDPLNETLKLTLLSLAEKSNVPVKAPHVIDCTVTVVLTVTVPPPDEASKVAESPDPGTDAPPAPFELAAQCVVSLASHVPVPPTQKRLAIDQTLT